MVESKISKRCKMPNFAAIAWRKWHTNPRCLSRTKMVLDGCQIFHVSLSALEHFGINYLRDAVDIVDMFIMSLGVCRDGGSNLNADNAAQTRHSITGSADLVWNRCR